MAQTIDIANPVRTQAILNEYGLHAKKKFGQNFLTDLNILHNIVKVAEITADDYVIEIGPGIGALTEQLAKVAKKVLAFEIDSQMVDVLSDTLQPYDNVKVIESDVLKVDLAKVIREEFGEEAHIKIVANLPYYITTPILMQLLRANLNWDNIVVMMQREVADRLNSQVGTKTYGALTLTVQYFAKATLAIKVPASAFNPSPNVDSAVVKLTPLEPEVIVDNIGKFFSVIKASFAHRRKSLWNNMIQTYGKDQVVKDKIKMALQTAEIDPSIRAERLDLKQFTQLYLALREQHLN
ncbi:ribosomal RNA small subunit methyltransferase A [Leuconostoc litchii]|uniref:Ribosomal RNA small subunit methyltransferase A n=1 Tax=Leuconostoc litchii TaxID=1981069 RepID=A0A652NE62_9LACO|nr:16S rRNA (adenine(1518)-N(6)/adenine(1519)-N(6))-dimethyltransferase RsmA [Leuconostoc litchii]TYC46010.1 16S rRNA (adenine(1518)-N(6)/adenine(1519)-N(6))-dimethyltransferase RsmA [Leuconostoc litchii]GMA70281.1 ribosomal RNA small subunit methyltransferase A [Leuconostoc litchii]